MALPARDLTQLLADLRRTRTLITPEELSYRAPAVVPTGLTALDALLGGGLPLGRLVELLPRPGGQTATALAVQALAAFTRSGRLTAWVDRPDALDPGTIHQAGVALSRLLWCRPRSRREALRAADALLASGAFPLVVLDAASPDRREANVPAASWMRLARAAEEARASLLVLGGGAGTFAAVALEPVRSVPRFAGRGPGRTFEGMDLTVSLTRSKLGLPLGEATLSFLTPELFPEER